MVGWKVCTTKARLLQKFKSLQPDYFLNSPIIRPVRHEIWTKLVGWKHEAITEIMFLGTMFLVRPVRHEIWTKLVGWKHEATTLLGNNLQTVFVECSFLENRIHDHIFF